MRKRTDHHLNALKHGAFSRFLILPWEGVAKFVKLYADLIDEWKPVGPTEEDAVLSIAKGLWRKRRMQAFLRNELENHSCDPNHVAYNEAEMLRVLYISIETRPDKFETWLRGLPTQKANDLRRKFPREDFQSVSDWVKAVQHEIASNLLPVVSSVEDLVGPSASVLFTDKAIEYDIGVEERIDAMIDRAIKRLVQTKAMKQMLGASTIEKGTSSNLKDRQTVSLMDRCRGIAHACTADGQQSRDRYGGTRQLDGNGLRPSARRHLCCGGRSGADWPKNPGTLAGRLRRTQTFLRTLGIEISFSRVGRA